MKSVNKAIAVVCLAFIVFQVNAQTKYQSYTTVCNIVQQKSDMEKMENNVPMILYIYDSVSKQDLALVFSQHVIKNMTYNPRQRLVNQNACISGTIKTFNKQPAIFITSEKQINVSDGPEVNKKTSNG